MERFVNFMKRHIKLVSFIIIFAGYAGIFVFFHSLKFPLWNDEGRFWPTSLSFSSKLIPTLHQLKNYDELSTPLPFVVFGVLEHLFHKGIAAGRFLNFILSFAIILIIFFKEKEIGKISVLSVIGIFLFPYFTGCSIHLYTDIIAVFFAFIGVVLYLKSRFLLGCISFVLAISSRQYMVAFPIALFICTAYEERHGLLKAWYPLFLLLISIASLAGWIVSFGGFGPQSEVAVQGVATAKLSFLLPNNGLYFLTCIGAYYVIPELLLFRDVSFIKKLPSRKNACIAIALFVLFIMFPPIQNIHYPHPQMGYIDRFVCLFLPDHLKPFIFYILALLACIRFSKINLAFWLLYSNVLLMFKAHVGWDKYALALLIVLWYLAGSKEPPNRDQTMAFQEHNLQ